MLLKKYFLLLIGKINHQNISEAAAYLYVAKRFIELKRFKAAEEFLEKSYSKQPSEQTLKIINQVKELNINHTEKSGLSVLFVVHNFPPNWYAGVENYTHSLAKSLIKLGINVSVLYPQYRNNIDSSFVEEDVFDEIKIYRLILKNNSNPASQITDKETEQKFSDILERKNFSIVHFHHFMGLPFSLARIAKEQNAKIVITLHDFWMLCVRTHLYRNQDNSICSGPESNSKCSNCLSDNLNDIDRNNLEKWVKLRNSAANEALNLANLIISPSQFLANKFKSFSCLKEISVIPQGLNVIKRENSKRTKKLTFGFIGAI